MLIETSVFEIVELYDFVATHEIAGLSASHPCHGVHLHKWSIEIVLLVPKLPPTDAPSDAALLQPLRTYVVSELEGSHLNDVVEGDPTPARLAAHLVDWCRRHLDALAVGALQSVTVVAGRGARARCRLVKVRSAKW